MVTLSETGGSWDGWRDSTKVSCITWAWTRVCYMGWKEKGIIGDYGEVIEDIIEEWRPELFRRDGCPLQSAVRMSLADEAEKGTLVLGWEGTK